MEELHFREFIEGLPQGYDDQVVIGLYQMQRPIREIATRTHKSIGEIYRVLQRHQVSPNRRKLNHHNVVDLNDSGIPVTTIADLTGYTPRHVRNILKRNNGDKTE